MSAAGKAGRSVVLGALAATVGVGAVLGMVAERALIGRNLRRDIEAGEPFGTLTSDPVEVTADDGVRLHAEVEAAIADHDDVTLVFAHGYALSMHEFHYQRRDLRGIARLVFFDQRGHGKSARGDRASHTVPQLAADLERIMETLAPSGKVVLVGHSMGGMTIQELAARRPEWFGTKIVATVLVCTSSGGVSEVPLGLPGGLGKFVQQVAPMVTGALHGKQDVVDRSREAASDLTLLLTRRYSFGTGATSHLTDFVAHLHGTTPIEVIGDFLHAFGEYDSTEHLAVLGRVPTYVIGAADDLMTPISHSEKIASLVPGAQLTVIPETGHMLPLERYVELNDLLKKVIREARGPLS